MTPRPNDTFFTRSRALRVPSVLASVMAVAVLLARAVPTAHGYMVRPPRSLSELNTVADFVFKGTVTETTEVKAGQREITRFFFGDSGTPAVYDARFKIVSLIKGKPTGETVRFEYFDDPTPASARQGFEQVRYHFVQGQSYVVFAQSSGTAGLYHQMTGGPCFQTDEGVVQCANASPVSAGTIHGVVWDELTGLLGDKDPTKKRYALRQLAIMTGIGAFGLREDDLDFPRDAVVALARPLVADKDVSDSALAITNPQGSTAARPRIYYECTPGETLSQTATKADFIFKGIALSSTSASAPPRQREDSFFGSEDEFADKITKFKVISSIKGSEQGGEVVFRHYEDLTPPESRRGEPGLAYHFEPGRAYIVMARRTADAAYCQLGPRFADYKADFGVLRCADARPAPAEPLQEIMWRELASLLRGADANDMEYAMRELDQLSGGLTLFDYRHGIDYQVGAVADLVHNLVNDPDPVVAQTAIAVIGAHSPYMNEENTAAWLSHVGTVPLPGLGAFAFNTNPGGAKYWGELAAVADGKADAITRAYAICALGLVREPALKSNLARWLTDTDVGVRSAAVILLADYPDLATRQRMTALASGSDIEILRATARSLGFGQRKDLADLLSLLLRNGDLQTRQFAAMSLSTLPVADPTVSKAMKEDLDHPEFGYLFVNALAGQNPQPYLDRLAKIAAGKIDTAHWWGGGDPRGIGWEILFEYIENHPSADIDGAELDGYFDSLETTNIADYTQKLLAFYKQSGLTERAAKLEQRAKSR